MNRLGILFTSLALNLTLAAALVVVHGRRTAVPAAQIITVNHPEAHRLVDEGHQRLTNTPATVAQPAKFHWGLVESADYRQYIANLRAVACPERLVREIIIADVRKLYDGKMREVNHDWDDWEPWYGTDRHQARNRERSARINALQAEQRALLKELLGVEPNDQWDEVIHDEGIVGIALGFLPEPKSIQFVAMIEEYREATHKVNARTGSILLKEDREELKGFRQGMMNRLNAMMTPAELEELNLRAQGLGKFMEGDIHLEGVTLSGAEFRQLCGFSRITGEIIKDDLMGDHEELSEEEEERRQMAFENEVKKLLGPARFADFERAQQPEFREALDFTEEHQLPISAAAKVSDALRHASEQAEAIKQNQALSADEQAAALTVLKSVTVNALSSALGSKYAKYAENNGTDLDDLFEMSSKTVEPPP